MFGREPLPFVTCLFFLLLSLSPLAAPGECFTTAPSGGAPVLHDPFDRENPLVKLPGIQLTYVKGHDRGTAIYFNGKTYLREPALTFVPREKNWTEGTVEFWIKPSSYTSASGSAEILLFNWNEYPKPQAGYVGGVALTADGRISHNCGWEWGGGNPPTITSRSAVPLEKWTHVAVAWSKKEGYTRIYLNNRLDAEIDMYCATGSIGRIYPWLAAYGGYIGAVDELKIYDAPVNPPFYGQVSAYAAKPPAAPYVPKPDSAPVSADVRAIPDFRPQPRDNDFALIIGIEKYQGLPASEFSRSDAGLVKDYMKALGLRERNIEFITDEKATKSGIEKSVEAWLPNRVNKNSRVFVYFSGHGAPDPARGDAYLVPYDGDPNYLPFTGYPLKRLYEKLEELQVREVTVILDSCFSGAGGRSVLARGARPLVMMKEAPVLSSRIAVLSATQGAQISTSSPERGHGVFTYFFLRAIQDGKQDIAGIYTYLKPLVEDEAKAMNVQQSPGLTPDLESLRGRFSLR